MTSLQTPAATIAGNGMPGDSPERGGMAREVPIDLPFGVENGPDGALYITAIGWHRVLRVDREAGRLMAVAGNGRRGYARFMKTYTLVARTQGHKLNLWPRGAYRHIRWIPLAFFLQ